MASMAVRHDDETLPQLSNRYATIVEKLESAFTDRESRAIGYMLRKVEEGAGEVSAVETLREKGGFNQKQARALVRLFVSARQLVSAVAS